MDCKDYKQWFSSYVDELLSLQERNQLEEHLGACGSCSDELNSLKEMLRSLRSMDQPAAPDLLLGIHRKLTREPWWQLAIRRFLAPWPQSLPLHSLALATTALLVVMVVSLPRFSARAPATASFDKMLELGLKSPQLLEGGIRKEGKLDQYEPYYAESKDELVATKPQAMPLTAAGGVGESSEAITARQGGDLAQDYAIISPSHDQTSGNKSLDSKIALKREASFEQEQIHDVANEVKNGEYLNLAGMINTPDTLTKQSEERKKESKGDASTTLASGALSVSGAVPYDADTLTLASSPSRSDERSQVVAKDNTVIEPGVSRMLVPESGAVLSSGNSSGSISKSEPTHETLEVELRVSNFEKARTEIIEWVNVKGGSVVQTNEHHLSIKLLASAVPQFLQQFWPDLPISWITPTEPAWTAISLELIPAE